MKTVILSSSAARAYDKLPDLAREQISLAINAYAMHGAGDIKAMSGTRTLRLRYGDFRVIFDETATSMTILALGNRREIYR